VSQEQNALRSRKLRVALVGCGQIADAHLQEVRKIADAELVAVCDRQADLAEQAAARFKAPARFTDLGELLEVTRPDVLHVTTPPHTHSGIARRALAAGVHVYVEKPFTVDAAEARELLALAGASGRLVCVGHDQLFDPAWLEFQSRHQRGQFGRVIHVESIQGYDLGGPFGRALASEPEHWVHRLPGGLFQNTISHALYRITELMQGDRPEVWATWFARPHEAFPTELRVLLRGSEATANLTFSSALAPRMRVTRIYGTRACVEVDFDGRLVRCTRAAKLPGPFGKLEVPFHHFREAFGTLVRNAWRFLRCDLQYFSGMNRLFRLFYQAIREGTQPPIRYEEIHRVTAILDDIFERCRPQEEEDVTNPWRKSRPASPAGPVQLALPR
jgi:predicted dehydrogenase